MQTKTLLVVAVLLAVVMSIAIYWQQGDVRHAEAVNKLLEYQDVNPFKQLGRQPNEH